MSEPSNGAWPFQEIPEEEGLDISAIFGNSSAAPQGDPFAPPAAAQSVPSPPTPVAQEITPAVAATSQPTTAPIVNTPAKAPAEAPAENPIAAAFEQKTAENTKKGLLEKPPVFYHKGVKEEIDDPSMTFEELRIRKSDDFTDLEEGKRVSWSVEYCGIRKEVKDPKGTTIISMKEMIERSREFLDALKKTKDKDPCCYVKPKVEMKTKGNAAYKGKFGTLEEARNSDKVICLIPSNDGRIYELRKMEQGEFIAPKKNVVDFSEVRAGFSPALPKIPAELMGQIIAFFRAFMTDHGENEAFAQIYWDKAEKRFFAYVPKQSVCKEEVEADLHDCLYDDEERYLCYADIHSHNSMDAFFSGKDDQDERSTGLYLVLGKLDKFYPDVKARIFCGDSFVSIDPNIVMEGLEQPFPKEWLAQVSIRSRKPERFKKPDMTVRIGSSHVLFASGNLRMLARLQGVDTYNVDAVIPKGYRESVTVKTADFVRELNYLKECSVLTAKPYVRFAGEQLSIAASGGAFETGIEVRGRGDMVLGFDLYHMLDALKQFKGEVEVCIHLSSPHAPIVIDAAGRSDFALVVPVRLKEEMAA